MGPRPVPAGLSIAAVIDAFAASCEQELNPGDTRLYRYVLFLLELCINNYGHRNLDDDERAIYESAYHVHGKHFFELFGAEKLLPELDFFCSYYLDGDVHTSDRVVKRAPEVVGALREWLVRRGIITPEAELRERSRAVQRAKYKHRIGKMLRALRESAVALDGGGGGVDYVASDHHLVKRVGARRVWLTVFRGALPETLGPLVVPECVSSGLRVGWTLRCSLGRVRGQWRVVDVAGIHPRV